MASFLPPRTTTATSVRVQCEAKDCRALLEVAVVPDCPDGAPLIVRCGSCQRLLEVNLGAGGHGGRLHQPQQGTYQMVKPPALFSGYGQYRQMMPMGGTEQQRVAVPMRNQLVQPPPLSRYHSLPVHQAHQGSSGLDDPFGICVNSLAAGQYGLDVQQQSAGSPFHSSTHFSGFDEHSPKAHFHGMHEISFEAGRRRKKEKKSKPRNPSPYNLFMSREVKRIKSENPKLDHRIAFKKAANNWAKSPHNCSNQRMSIFGAGVNGQPVKQELDPSGQAVEMAAPDILHASPLHCEDAEKIRIQELSKDSCEDEQNVPSVCEGNGNVVSVPEHETSVSHLKRVLETSLPDMCQVKRVKVDPPMQPVHSALLGVQEDTSSVAIPDYGLDAAI